MPQERPRPPKRLKPWTVAVYMIADSINGSSALDASAEQAQDDIKTALAAAGANATVNVAMQMDFKETPKTTQRLIVHRHKDWTESGRHKAAGDPEVLEQFLDWVQRECPAERYVVHFWGHSSGPVGLFFEQAHPNARPDGLTLPELGRAFKQSIHTLGQLVDIVLLKDCWMSTLEAACELRDGAKFMVSSQTRVPIDGWPYKEMFECLSSDETPTVAARLVEVLGDYYDVATNRPKLNEVAYGAVDVDAARAADGPLRALAGRLDALNGAERAASRTAVRRSSRGDPALVDVVTMCDNLSDLADGDLGRHAADLSQAVKASVIAHRPEPSVYQGLSLLYFPAGATPAEQEQDSYIASAFFVPGLNAASGYRTLKLSKHTEWQRIALENYKPPPKGKRAMAGENVKGDGFGIDWADDGSGNLTITLTKKPKKKAKAAPKSRRTTKKAKK
jgi:Clostripain family